jgi:hypothetical protein
MKAITYTLDLNPSTSLRTGSGLTQVLSDGTTTYTGVYTEPVEWTSPTA